MAIVYGSCNDTVAHLPGVVAAVRAVGNQGAAEAEAILAFHFETGASKIEVDYGVTDTVVSLVDEAAVSIEFGRTGALGRGASQGVFALTGAFGI